jgi:hypothetical protein
LIHGTPQIVVFAVDGEKDLIQMPLVSKSWVSTPELVGISLAERPPPFTDCLIGHDDIAGEQEFFQISVSEAEAEVRPDALAEALGWEAVILASAGR